MFMFIVILYAVLNTSNHFYAIYAKYLMFYLTLYLDNRFLKFHSNIDVDIKISSDKNIKRNEKTSVPMILRIVKVAN